MSDAIFRRHFHEFNSLDEEQQRAILKNRLWVLDGEGIEGLTTRELHRRVVQHAVVTGRLDALLDKTHTAYIVKTTRDTAVALAKHEIGTENERLRNENAALHGEVQSLRSKLNQEGALSLHAILGPDAVLFRSDGQPAQLEELGIQISPPPSKGDSP